MKYNMKSKYVRFAKAYMDKKGLYTFNEYTNQREYSDIDIFEGILILRDHENRNRGNKEE
jgi:hypothetical protein